MDYSSWCEDNLKFSRSGLDSRVFCLDDVTQDDVILMKRRLITDTEETLKSFVK
jgi:hypothetical protein